MTVHNISPETNKNKEPGTLEYITAWIIIIAAFFAIYIFFMKPKGYDIRYMKNLITGSKKSDKKTKAVLKVNKPKTKKPKENQAVKTEKSKAVKTAPKLKKRKLTIKRRRRHIMRELSEEDD